MLKKEKLEKELKLFERDLQNFKNQKEYIKLQSPYEDMTNRIRIRNRCKCFEQGEKSTINFS